MFGEIALKLSMIGAYMGIYLLSFNNPNAEKMINIISRDDDSSAYQKLSECFELCTPEQQSFLKQLSLSEIFKNFGKEYSRRMAATMIHEASHGAVNNFFTRQPFNVHIGAHYCKNTKQKSILSCGGFHLDGLNPCVGYTLYNKPDENDPEALKHQRNVILAGSCATILFQTIVNAALGKHRPYFDSIILHEAMNLLPHDADDHESDGGVLHTRFLNTPEGLRKLLSYARSSSEICGEYALVNVKEGHNINPLQRAMLAMINWELRGLLRFDS